jgi:hypothetical protein
VSQCNIGDIGYPTSSGHFESAIGYRQFRRRESNVTDCPTVALPRIRTFFILHFSFETSPRIAIHTSQNAQNATNYRTSTVCAPDLPGTVRAQW